MRKPDFSDLLVLTGIGSLFCGLYLISLSLALIITGIILFSFGLYTAWLKASAGGEHGK